MQVFLGFLVKVLKVMVASKSSQRERKPNPLCSKRTSSSVSLKALKERESPILYVARGQAQVCVSLIGTMDMGSWVHLILSLSHLR